VRIIVTGASGFLGRAVLTSFSTNGIEVIGLSRSAIDGLTCVQSYVDAPSGDVLVHLAEANDRAWVNAQGAEYETAAIDSFHCLLAKRYTRTIYASSAAIYGDACNWHRRTDEVVTPTDAYMRIKHACEQAVLQAGGIAVRFTNLYGPGMAKSNVVSAVLSQLTLDGPISLYDTSPVRDFLWVNNAAEAVLAMVKVPTTGIFNVGTAIGTSIQTLVETALKEGGQEGRPILSRTTNARASTLTVDITPTIAAFQWQPSMLLADGLSQLIAHP